MDVGIISVGNSGLSGGATQSAVSLRDRNHGYMFCVQNCLATKLYVQNGLAPKLSLTWTRASRRRKFPKHKWPIVQRHPVPTVSFPRQPFGFFSERRSKVFTLHTPHFTLHSSHSTLQTSHSTLQTSHSTLHTSHFSLLTASFTLQTSHFTLHTALFALQTETSHSTLHTPHFTLHTSHFSLLPSHSKPHTSHFTLHTALFALQT